jgi:cytidylate kinase
VAERDRAAADYLKRFHGVDWSGSLLYHLILNTGRRGGEPASRLIVKALACGSR